MSLQVPQSSFPAKGSPQVAGVRSKVALKPGRSLMDWIRLGRTAKDLSGTGGKILKVTTEELAKHNKVKDCWIAIRGMVYNVTPYMEFHPGGEDEMMRGAGIDGTMLFDEVHKWVNVESMLEKCFVGKLEGYATPKGSIKSNSSSSLSIPSSPSGTLVNGTVNSTRVELPQPPVFAVPASPPNQNKPRYEWFQSDKTVTIAIYSKWKQMPHENVIIDRTGKTLLVTLLVNNFTYCVHTDLEGIVSNEYSVNVQGTSGKVEVVFKKSAAGQWTNLGTPLEKNNSYIKTMETETTYRTCRVSLRQKVTHDTNLYCIELPEGCRMCVPLGHHVHIKATVEGMEIIRSYTVVPPNLVKDSPDFLVKEGRRFYLMIKIYSDGALTSVIGKLNVGDTLEVSTHEGNFVESRLANCRELVMLAAGTGFTPMAGLINAAFTLHWVQERKVHLIFFNKKERDILWNSELEKLKESQSSFQLTHVLSDADAEWSGLKGRIREELVTQFLPSSSEKTDLLVCACGPTAFTKEAIRLVVQHGINEDQTHSFLG